jgi:hypothetical protein
VYLAITIDTEEDNWGEYARRSYSVDNVRAIPRLQELFIKHDVRPTYLITYPIATSDVAVDMFGGYRRAGLCEIGTHLHPWNTPPVEEALTPFNSYVSHLPADLQFRKLRTLHETIARNFGTVPTSYRSGRWAFSEDVARNLMRLGYRVDTSISPATDWRQYEGPDYSSWTLEPFVYRAAPGPCGAATLLEVPATIDFLQSHRLARAAFRTIKDLPFGGKALAALRRLRMVNHIALSPELHDAPDMIAITKAILARGSRAVNMFFHSPSLIQGRTPFVKTAADVDAFFGRIDAFLSFTRSAGLRPVTLSEFTPAIVGASSMRLLTGHVDEAAVR